MIQILADYTLIVILVVSAVVLVADGFKRGIWWTYPFIIMSGLTALLIAKLASITYQPSAVRPFIEKGVAPGAAFIDNPGFPSDHALLGVAALLAVYAGTKRRTLSVVLLTLVCVMMIGRVLALVHTPLDVIGGAFAACLGSLWYIGMRRHIKT